MRAPESAHPGSVYQTPINLTSRWSCAINLSSDLAELFEGQHSAKQRRNKIVIRNPAREDWVSRIQMVTGLVPSRMNEAPDLKNKKKGTKKKEKRKEENLGGRKMGRKLRKSLAEEFWMVPPASRYNDSLDIGSI